MSRKQNALWGFLFDIGGTGILQATTFLVTPLYLDSTSSELYGYWLTIGSVLAWLYLSDFGIGMALSRLVISAIEKKDKLLFNNLVSSALLLFLVAAIIIIGLGVSLTNVFINWFHVKPEYVFDFRLTYYLAVFSGALSFPFSIFSAVIEAHQKISFNRIVTSISSLIGLGITITLLLLGFDLLSFATGMLATILLNGAGSIYYFKILCPDFSFFSIGLKKEAARKLMNFGGYFQVGKLANIVALNTDNIIIASFLGASFVTIYTFTSKLAILISVTFISKIPSALFPAISQLVEQKNQGALKTSFISLLKVSIRIGIVSATFVYVVNEKFVLAWVGEGNYGGYTLNALWVYMIFFDSIIRCISIYIFSFSNLRVWSLVSLAEAILNISLSLILVGPFGLIGVAAGTVVSRTITIGIYTPLFLKKKLSFKTSELFRDAIFSTLLRSAPGIIVILLLSRVEFNSNHWVWIIGLGITSVLLNFIFFELLFLIKLKGYSIKQRFVALKSYY